MVTEGEEHTGSGPLTSLSPGMHKLKESPSLSLPRPIAVVWQAGPPPWALLL